jgi:hypothetical protein
MNQDAEALRSLIARGEIGFDEMRAQVLALPLSEIAQSQTLLAAFASVTEDNRLRMAALARIARIGRRLTDAPKHSAREKAAAARDKQWAERYGPQFDLYACIAQAASDMGVPLEELRGGPGQEPEWHARPPSKADQRRITGAVKRELIQRFPDRWSDASRLFIDKKAFAGAAARAPRIDWPDE